MLPAEARLRSAADFKATVREGVRVGRPTLVVHMLANRGGARVGVVVSKAVGNAVVRNKIKRRIRALTQRRLDDLGGVDLVVRALPTAADRTFAELGADLDGAIRSARRRMVRQ